MGRYLYNVIALTAMLVLLAGTAFAADVVVIVNKDNSNAVSRGVIEKIYKGDVTSWPGGGVVVAYDLPEGNDSRAELTRSLLGMSVSTLKASWTVKLFSGKATPPKTMASDSEMKSAVAANKNAIGYISASSLDGSVKSVLSLP